MTNINFLLKISIQCQEIRLWELIKWSPKRKCFDLFSNSRARNNGRSTDNVRTDWGVDQSTFRLAGHVDRSQSIVLKTIVISMWQVAVHCETLIWNPGWNTTTTVVYNSRIETDIGVHALSVTKLKIFSLLWVKQQLKGVWSVAEKKVKFRGIFREIRRKIGWYRGNFAEIFGTNFAEKQ